MDKLQKKHKIRDALKNVIYQSLNEALQLIEKEETEENVEKLNSYRETLKRKIGAVKTLEDEIIELEEDEGNLVKIIEESNTFEIECKAKLNIINRHTQKNVDRKREKKENNNNVKLPKLEITKFDGDAIKWKSFADSFHAAIDSCTQLSDVEKFNYLRSFLVGDALHAIDGLSLTNENYKEAMSVLKNRFGNTQLIISSHMNALVKIPKVLHEDLVTLRKFYDDVESHVRSLKNLGVESESYGSLLSTVVMDKLPEEIKLIVSRNIKQDTWTLTNVLNVINAELRARESCTIPDASQDGKNVGFSNFTVSSLHSSHSRHSDSRSHFKRSSGKPQSLVCAFCKGNHWADKCNVISDVDGRKDFLQKGKLCFMCLRPDHISRNCTRTRSCFFCKGMHNSSICNNRDKNSETKPDENNKVSTNCASNISSVLLQTAEILVENPINKKQVKVKVLLPWINTGCFPPSSPTARYTLNISKNNLWHNSAVCLMLPHS